MLPLHPLKMPSDVGAALGLWVNVLQFHYTNINGSDKCKLNTCELGRIKNEEKKRWSHSRTGFFSQEKDNIHSAHWNRCNTLERRCKFIVMKRTMKIIVVSFPIHSIFYDHVTFFSSVVFGTFFSFFRLLSLTNTISVRFFAMTLILSNKCQKALHVFHAIDCYHHSTFIAIPKWNYIFT